MTILYSNDFESATAGTLPAGWSNARGTFQVQTDSPISGSKALRSATMTVGDFVVYAGVAAQTTQRVTFAQTVAGSLGLGQDNCFGQAFRCAADASSGYLYLMSPEGGGSYKTLLYKITGSNAYSLLSTQAAVLPSVASGETILMEVYANGSTLECRVWKSTGTRPSSPSHTFTDSSYSSGHIGYYLSRSGSAPANVPAIDDVVYEDGAAAGATAITLSGPSSGVVGAASSNFTVGANGAISGTITVTPNDGSGGGTFSPTSVNISSGSPTATFTYTAASAGAKTIAVTNGGALSNPASITYTATTVVTYPVTDAAIFWSPYTWYSNGGGAMQANNVKGSSTYAWSCTRGAYLKFKATVGASGSITLNIDTTTLSSVGASGRPQLCWTVGGSAQQSRLLSAGDASVVLASGLAAGTYEVFVGFRGVYITQDGSIDTNYTTPLNRVQVTGIQLSTGGTLSATTVKPKRLIVYGDSITEGDLVAGYPRTSTSQDAFLTYSWMMAAALDAEVGILGYYGQRWDFFNISWANYASGTSRLSGGLLTPAPDFVVVNYGENDGNPGPASSAVTSTLAAIAAAAPSAKIVLNIPFSGKARANLSAATRPSNCVLVDLARPEMLPGSLVWSDDGQHPNQRGHANLAGLLAAATLAASVGTTTRTVSLTLTGAGALTGLKWAWRDSFTGAILSSGTTGSTNSSSVFTASVNTALSVGGTGWLEVNNSDGTVGTDFKGYSGPAQVS